MKRFTLLSLMCLSLACLSNGYDLFANQKEYEFNIETSVDITTSDNSTVNEWSVSGKLYIQRRDEHTLAVLFKPGKAYFTAGEHFNESTPHEINKASAAIYTPFKVQLDKSGVVEGVYFQESEPVWSANIKRSIAYALQLREQTEVVYSEYEDGLYGNCKTDYYVTKGPKTTLVVTKTPLLETCHPLTDGSYSVASILPDNPCDDDEHEDQVMVSNTGKYTLGLNGEIKYLIEADIMSHVTIQTSAESESQVVYSEFKLSKGVVGDFKTTIDIEAHMNSTMSSLQYVEPEPTYRIPYGRSYFEYAKYTLHRFYATLDEQPTLNEPYDDKVSILFQIFAEMDQASFTELYEYIHAETDEDRKEVYSHIFTDLLQKTGTNASFSFVKHLILSGDMSESEILTIIPSLPFYITKHSEFLVEEFEFLFNFQNKKYSKHVHELAVLSFANMIYKTHYDLSTEKYEKYVQNYFHAFESATSYSEQMLYIEAIANLQLGTVYEKLIPYITNSTFNDDLKFLAMYAAYPSVVEQKEKTFETFWPIFVKKTNSLQTRVAAFGALLVSHPTPGRLMSIHRVMHEEKCPHMINYYITTINSIVHSANPCYERLSHLVSYMSRNLPQAPPARFWVTGNYLFDYKDFEFHTGGSVETTLIGNEKYDGPMVGYFAMKTEALGKYTSDFAIYIKARGVTDSFFSSFDKTKVLNVEKLEEIFKSMHLHLNKHEPLHVEFSLTYQEKVVLSYYYDGKEVTLEEVVNVVTAIVTAFTRLSDFSSIDVDMPYFEKHHLPTIFGTPIDVTLQKTHYDYINGSFDFDLENYHVNSQLSYKYSSDYSSVATTYNPYLAMLHVLERQQGTMFYLPTNVSFAFVAKSIQFSQFRPAHLVSGYSTNTRTLFGTVGSPDFDENYGQLYVEPEYHVEHENVTFTVNDFGLTFSVNYTSENIKNYINAITGDVDSVYTNTHVLDDEDAEEVDYQLKLMNAMQIHSLHFGEDRFFKIDWHSEEDSYVSYRWMFDYANDSISQGFDIVGVMQHKLSEESTEVLHQWTGAWEFLHVNDTKFNVESYYHRIDYTKETALKDIRYCSNFSYNPMVFMESPEIYEYEAKFGFNAHTEKGCDEDFFTYSFKVTQDYSPSTKKESVEDVELHAECPIDILKFDPIPYDDVCTEEDLEAYATLSHYAINVKYYNYPEFITPLFTRFSYLVSAYLPDKLELLNLTNGFDLSFHALPEEDSMELAINDRKMHLPNYLDYFELMPDMDQDVDKVQAIEYGFARSCSIIKDRLNSFDDEMTHFYDWLPTEDKRDTCGTLLFGDCSENPIYALFLETVKSGEHDYTYKLKVYTGGHYIDLAHEAHSNSMYVQEGETCYNLNETTYTYPTLSENDTHKDEYGNVKLTIFQNDEGLIVLKSDVFKTKVQFNGKDVLSVITLANNMKYACGICNHPKHYEEDVSSYTYCGDHKPFTCHH